MADEDSGFADAFARVRYYLKARYDVTTIEFLPDAGATLHGFSDDRIADFNPSSTLEGGRNIKVRDDIPVEFKLFSLLHLFGHIVQFNESEDDAKLALRTGSVASLSEAELIRTKDYEKRASQYGIAVLNACDLPHLVSWLSSFWAADWRFLEDVYRGRKRDVPDQYVDIAALLRDRKTEYAVEPGMTLDPIALPMMLNDNPRFAPRDFRIL